MIALVAVGGSLPHLSSADQPPNAKKERVHRPPWFRKHLTAMKEPNLSKLAEADHTTTAYRFLWLPTFLSPITVRVVKSDHGVVSYAVRLDGQGGYEPGIISARESASLRPAHWQRIASALAKAKFWILPPSQREPFGQLTGDGEVLVLEGVSDGKCHFQSARSSELRGTTSETAL
jgi:hypothetical protein